MSITLRVLVLEDRLADAELIIYELRQAGFDPAWKRIDNEADFLANLDPPPDIILSDYFMPPWDGLRALHTLQENGSDIPFIIVTGTIGEDVAVECMREGADDYLLKDRLGRLGQAVTRALLDRQQRVEHKRVENTFHKMYTVVEQSGSSVIITDLQGNIQYVNPKFSQITGYSADEVIGINPRVLKSGETPPEVYKQLWAAISVGDEWLGEFHNKKKSGELFWELASITAVRDSNGQMTGYLAIKEDITERKRTEAELAASEMRFRRLFEAAQDGILILDVSTGQIRQVNPFLLDLLGYSHKELLGKALWEIGQFKDIFASQESFRELQDEGYIRYEDIPLETRDGRRIQVEFVSNVYKVGDEKVIQCNIRDITERKRVEEQLAAERNLLRTLIDHLPDRVYVKDTEGHFTLKNAVDARQMGAASTDEVIGRTDFDYYPLELAEQYYADDQAVIQSGQSLNNREEPFIAADGTQGWMLTSKLPLRNMQGNVVGLVGIGRNISERKAAEEKIRKLNRTLRVLSDVNQAIVRIRSASALFEEVCRIAVDVGGFRIAWIGLLDYETRRVNPVASMGVTDDYLEKMKIVVDEGLRGQGPTGSAINTGEYVVSQDIELDPRLAPWREDALNLGYRSSAAFPLKVASHVRGVLTLYAASVGFFDDEELKLLDEMAADISFAMEFAEEEALRKRAETALRLHVQAIEEMRLFLHTTLDAFPANTVVLDTDGSIINVNLAWIQFANNNDAPSPMHYLGTNYLTICDTSAGPQSEQAIPAADGIRAVIDGSRDEAYLEYPCPSPSEKRWFAMRVTPFPELAPRRVVVAHINITARKQVEEQLQKAHGLLEQRIIERTAQLESSKQRIEAILNSSPEGILLLYSDLRIRQANPAFNKLFGILPEEYVNKPLFDLIYEPDEQVKTVLVQAFGLKSPVGRLETRVQRKDDTVFDIELSFGYIPEGGLVCIISDISIRKQAEKILEQALTTEKELGELKSRFVSMASHEFRTPLATILATADTLSAYRQRMTEDQIEQKLSKIKEQVADLKDIMDDVLQLSRMQARRVEFNPVVLDIDAFCRSVIEEFQSRPDIHHELVYSFSGSVPYARLDKKLMRQILSNLISNAIKYSPAEKSISIQLSTTEQTLLLSVADHGIGIPESDQMHVFEPFHRAGNVGTISGTGLGLIITKESVDLHGGTLTFESQVDVGTTFKVHIPVIIEGGQHDDENPGN